MEVQVEHPKKNLAAWLIASCLVACQAQHRASSVDLALVAVLAAASSPF
jgi:hypothetical protein